MNQENFYKFLFLGVMIFATLFVSQGPLRDLASGSGENKNYVSLSATAAEPILSGAGPRFDLLNKEEVISITAAAESKAAGEAEELERDEGEKEAPRVLAASALVADLLGSRVYFELDSARRWPLASLTKLMTAAVTFENLEMEKEVALEKGDFDFEAQSAALRPGEKYQVEDLLWVMLVNSSNASAEALARVFGKEKFVSLMNQKAKEEGLFNTYFDDVTGLSVSNQSTAYDLRKLAAVIYSDEERIFQMTGREGWTVKELGSGRFLKILTNNEFVGRNDFLGGKTGYTEEAYGNLLSIFSYRGRPVVIIVLGSQDRFGETEKLYEWFKQNYE